MDKTLVMKTLDKNKIEYNYHTYDNSRALNGEEVALAINKEAKYVYKTLVLQSKSSKYYVFVIPVLKTLDLKKAAKSVNEKYVEMLPMKELLPLTGYIHGGCSPIGMKKRFTTVIDDTAKDLDKIIFSAGKIGFQVEVSLKDLKKIIEFKLDDVVEE